MTANSAADTIVALSTPPGRGALLTLRFSGPLSIEFVIRYCYRIKDDQPHRPYQVSEIKPRTSYYFILCDKDSPAIDDGIFVFYKNPSSFTGEDSLEVTLHGNPIIAEKAIDMAIKSGIRPALRGEFSRRAFLNNKMDLTKAESIRALIDARSEFELVGARKLYSGQLLKEMNRMRSRLIGLKAEQEAEVDFSTEDLTYESRENRLKGLIEIRSHIQELLDNGSQTRKASAGFQVAIVGVPNAGKSSLLNRMLGWDRSIVSEIAGTTRDSVAEEIELSSYRLRFVDTAGIRKSEDRIEQEGVRRSHSEMHRSGLILHVIDSENPKIDDIDLTSYHHATIFEVWNKCDKEQRVNIRSIPENESSRFEISCLTGQGIDELKQSIIKWIEKGVTQEDPLLLESRHVFHLNEIVECLSRCEEMWFEAPDEIIAIEMDDALKHAGEITGQINHEEVLGRIFSIFCVGK